MITNLYKKDVAELYNTPIVQQTAFWSVVKRKLGLNTIALNFKSSGRSLYNNINSDYVINSDLLVIIMKINKTDCIAYVPYGPELEPTPEFQGSFLEELSESLRQYLPKNCIMIRYDLCWESYWAKEDSLYDCEGNWLGEPPEYSQEIRFNFNTCNRNFRKAYTNILPSNTIFLNLQPHIRIILDRMKPKTRYNIRLSQRKGVYVKKANIESLNIWYNLYKETALRNKIHLNEIKYFEALLTAKAENTKSPAEAQLLIAEQNNVPLASMFLIISDNRGAYLYGASSNRNRNLMAPYALQWEAIKIAKEKGCTEYDMFGVAPNAASSHPLYGLYKFKTGFGGNIFHSLGCWDYPFNEERYDYFRSSEISNQGFHLHS
jgi:lipid II:glycine glycyltransferase (peptidoglycan interpeptide bridge formation enzyme)